MSDESTRRTSARNLPWLALVLGLVLLAGLVATRVTFPEPAGAYFPPTGSLPPSSGNPEPSRASSACAAAAPTTAASRTVTTSLAGGRITLPLAAVPYTKGPLTASSVPMMSGVTSYQKTFTDHPGWGEEFGVGQIPRTAGMADLGTAARGVIACMTSSTDAYSHPPTVGEVTVTTRSVGSWPAALAVVDLTLNPSWSSGVTGERLYVLVVDDGRADQWSLLFATAMNTDTAAQTAILAAIDQVSPV